VPLRLGAVVREACKDRKKRLYGRIWDKGFKKEQDSPSHLTLSSASRFRLATASSSLAFSAPSFANAIFVFLECQLCSRLLERMRAHLSRAIASSSKICFALVLICTSYEGFRFANLGSVSVTVAYPTGMRLVGQLV
jgi:hypothetical protein